MRREHSAVVIAFLMAATASDHAARAQSDEIPALTPAYWSVTGVASNDVLNIRDVPSADSRSVGTIPPNAHGVKNLGCRRNELSLERWMKASKSERQEAQMLWCRIEYRGVEGWVAGRYLKEDDTPKR